MADIYGFKSTLRSEELSAAARCCEGQKEPRFRDVMGAAAEVRDRTLSDISASVMALWYRTGTDRGSFCEALKRDPLIVAAWLRDRASVEEEAERSARDAGVDAVMMPNPEPNDAQRHETNWGQYMKKQSELDKELELERQCRVATVLAHANAVRSALRGGAGLSRDQQRGGSHHPPASLQKGRLVRGGGYGTGECSETPGLSNQCAGKIRLKQTAIKAGDGIKLDRETDTISVDLPEPLLAKAKEEGRKAAEAFLEKERVLGKLQKVLQAEVDARIMQEHQAEMDKKIIADLAKAAERAPMPKAGIVLKGLTRPERKELLDELRSLPGGLNDIMEWLHQRGYYTVTRTGKPVLVDGRANVPHAHDYDAIADAILETAEGRLAMNRAYSRKGFAWQPVTTKMEA